MASAQAAMAQTLSCSHRLTAARQQLSSASSSRCGQAPPAGGL